MRFAKDSGAKKILLPWTSAVALETIQTDLMSSFSLTLYQSEGNAMFKALEVEQYEFIIKTEF